MDSYDDRKATLTRQIADAEHHLDELYTRSQEQYAPPVLASEVDALAAHRDELTNELADLEEAHPTDPADHVAAARRALADLDAHLQDVGEWDAAAEEYNTRAAKAQEALTRWQRYRLYREAGADHGAEEAVDDGQNRAAIDAEFETYWQDSTGLADREHDIAIAAYRETREAFCHPNEAWQASTDALHAHHFGPDEPDHADVGEAGGLEIVDWDNGGREALERISRGEDPATVLADTPTRQTPYRIVEIDDQVTTLDQDDEEQEVEEQEVERITEDQLSRVISAEKLQADLQRIIDGESAHTVLAENFDDPTALNDHRHDRDSHQRAQRAADQLAAHDAAQETSRADDVEDDEEPTHHRSRDHAGTSRDLERQL